MNTPTNIPVSAFRLAHHHSHGWAEIIDSRPEYANRVFEQRDGLIPADIIRDVDKIMMESPDNLGLMPERTHTTGTGRTTWLCAQNWTTLEIHRPASVAGGVCGSLGVLRFQFPTDSFGLMSPKHNMLLVESEHAEARHYAELLYLSQVLGIREIISETPHADEIYRRILTGMGCEDWEEAYSYGITPWTPSVELQPE